WPIQFSETVSILKQRPVPSQGPLSPGGVTQFFSGGTAWANVNNIKADDGNNATVTLGAGGYSSQLVGHDFGFSIPSNATITGIKLEADLSSTNEVWVGFSIWPDGTSGGSSWTLFQTGIFPGGYISVGGENDLSLAPGGLTPEQVNNANGTSGFLASLHVGNFGAGATVAVDHFRVTVYYTEPIEESWPIQFSETVSITSLITVSDDWVISDIPTIGIESTETIEESWPILFSETVSIQQQIIASDTWSVSFINIPTTGIKGTETIEESWPILFSETVSITSLITVSDDWVIQVDDTPIQDLSLIRDVIQAEWESKWIAHNGIGAYKRYKHLTLYADSSSGGGDIIVQWRILKTRNRVRLNDQTFTSGSQGGQWDVSKWNQAVWASDTQNIFHIRNLGRGNAIKFRFVSVSADSRPGIRQVDLLYEVFGNVKA
ncbi:MAG TPA: hypothetical protein V6C99_12385, partial [Oculatellaceae cyanobacterium]